jgi:hypothetical protein
LRIVIDQQTRRWLPVNVRCKMCGERALASAAFARSKGEYIHRRISGWRIGVADEATDQSLLNE